LRGLWENLEKMENKKEMRNWLNEFNLTHPLVIAGLVVPKPKSKY
jgi:hypothetical protein